MPGWLADNLLVIVTAVLALVAFAIAWLTAEEVQTVHEVAGYVMAGLIAFRLVWGIVGSRYARFNQFLRCPSATLAYLGDVVRRRDLGHNPGERR